MKKLIASIMLGALLVVGAFANVSTDTAMEVEPSIFSVDPEAPGSDF